MPRRIESHSIPGAGYGLEALLEEPESGAPRIAVLVCHPHPQFGGTMHNKVVHRMARALRHGGAVVLRFNFRKVGEVEAGMEDAQAALDWLRARYPGLPYALAGFSFGSRVITRMGCDAVGARFLLAAGFPTRFGSAEYLRDCAATKIFIQSTNDQYGPRLEFGPMYATFGEPKELHWIDATDHFFAGALDELESLVERIGSRFQ